METASGQRILGLIDLHRKFFLVVIGLCLLAGLGYHVVGATFILTKAWLSQGLLEHAYAETKRTGGVVKPWPWADIRVAARLEFKRQNITRIVLSGHHGEALAFAPGMVTINPGSTSVSVISAHRDTHFAFLKDILIGDVFELEVLGQGRRQYQVQEEWLLDAKTARIHATNTHAVLLSTCLPDNEMTGLMQPRRVLVGLPMQGVHGG